MRHVLSLDWDWFADDCALKAGCCGWKCSFENNRNRGDKEVPGSMGSSPRNPHSRMETLLKHPFTINKLVVAECHASILPHLRAEDDLVHLDFHSDEAQLSFYTKHRPACGNWVTIAKLRFKGIKVHYYHSHPPRQYADHYDVVFLCKSSPWTPPEYDPLFHRFVRQLSARSLTTHFYGHRGRELRREHHRILRLGGPLNRTCPT